MKQIFVLFCFFPWFFLFSQNSVGVGYKLGRFIYNQAPIENFCTKFNLGWDLSLSEDNCLIFFTPNKTEKTISKKMLRRNLPHGVDLFFSTEMLDNLNMNLRIHSLRQSTVGERTNSLSEIEKLELTSRYRGFSIDFEFVKYKKIRPIIGFDLGVTSILYSLTAKDINIKNQILGYKTKLSGNVKPGDKELTFSTNTGIIFELFKVNNFSFLMTPVFQWGIGSAVKISQGAYYPMLLNHSNLSVSISASYEF